VSDCFAVSWNANREQPGPDRHSAERLVYPLGRGRYITRHELRIQWEVHFTPDEGREQTAQVPRHAETLRREAADWLRRRPIHDLRDYHHTSPSCIYSEMNSRSLVVVLRVWDRETERPDQLIASGTCLVPTTQWQCLTASPLVSRSSEQRTSIHAVQPTRTPSTWSITAIVRSLV